MARNRKRAKERRVRQGQPVASGRRREAGVMAAGDEGFENVQPLDGGGDRDERPQSPHDLGEGAVADGDSGDGAPDPLEHATPDVELAEAQLATASRVYDPSTEDEVLDEEAQPATPAVASRSAVAAPRPWLGARVLGFLEGSWRELQRVQWPDRRQVLQATGVVIGFVIVASVFLGVADLVANKVVHFILNGHF